MLPPHAVRRQVRICLLRAIEVDIPSTNIAGIKISKIKLEVENVEAEDKRFDWLHFGELLAYLKSGIWVSRTKQMNLYPFSTIYGFTRAINYYAARSSTSVQCHRL